MGTDGKLMEIDDNQNPRKYCRNRENWYVPMYHLVEADKKRRSCVWYTRKRPILHVLENWWRECYYCLR
jgi:hypothetical protein